MYRLAIILTLLLASGVQAGDSYGGIELLFSPSARASGMGESGVSHVHAKSFYFNPGSLGLFALENKISISGNLQNVLYREDNSLNNISFSAPLFKSTKRSKFLFAVGGYRTTLESIEPIPIFTRESRPNLLGYVSHKASVSNISFSLGYTNRIQIGVGASIKKFREDLADDSINESAYDIGVVFRYPFIPKLSNKKNTIYLIPTVGYSSSNNGLGLDRISFDYYYGNPFFGLFEYYNTYLQKRDNLGMSFEIGLVTINTEEVERKIFYIMPSFQLTRFSDFSNNIHMGLEIGIMELLFFRVGNNESSGNSKGFSINSRGLFHLLHDDSFTKSTRSGINKFFTDKISIEYSYANSVIMKSYHEIIITFQI